MIPLRKQIGQMLIVGVEGHELTSLEQSWLKIVQPGGVILFRRNIEDAAQTYRLLNEADSLSQPALFRCVDLEGGLVDRLRDAVAPMPSLAAVASTGKPSTWAQHGKLIGREARLLGFNVVLAPVLDLALPGSKSVMRSRTSFSQAADVVAYASVFLTALASKGVMGCGKHFPGLGGGIVDSHLSTPLIDRRWDELWANDLLPYRELRSQLPMVMISHATYSQVRSRRPASTSSFWIREVLLKKVGYRGLVLSDDLEMGGILTQMPIEAAACQAVEAGTHLLEICKDPSLVLRAYEALLHEAERSAVFRKKVESAFRKITLAKGKLTGFPMSKSPSQAQLEKLRHEISKFRSSHPEPISEVPA